MPEMADVKKFETLTLGSIGTPVTYEYLKQHTEILQQMYKAVPFELLVIASAALPPIEGVPTCRVDWSSETEAELLKRSHIGIMPLPDTPFARGKSSFKLIQYLSAKIPAIASPVGENNIVLRHRETGVSASTAAEWIYALHELSTPEKRERFSKAIAAEAEKYSLSNAASVMSEFFDRTLFQ
jgi:glycosyltransferase involved in cell wall biosynthesis